MHGLEQEKKDFFEQGFITFNIGDHSLIDSVNRDIETLISMGGYKTNSAVYSYNQYPRIVESYKFSDNCKKLAFHSSVMNRLKYFYGFEPLAFSTINFLHSTQQPLHSDYVHFRTIPHRMLTGVWVALEDIDPNSGPLQIVPKSHLLDLFDYEDIGADRPKNLNSVKPNYQLYEKYVVNIIERNALKAVTPKLSKGDCLLCEANLLHGSPECRNPSLTRKAQVTHWTFDNVQKHYNPSFSNIKKNIFVERQLNLIN